MKYRIVQSVVLATSLVLACAAQDQAVAQPNTKVPIFIFHTDEFWLNLHHFLYVLGRAENKERDAAREAVSDAPADMERGLKKLSVNEQTIWRQAVSTYAGSHSKKDIVFDDPMPAITLALVGAREA